MSYKENRNRCKFCGKFFFLKSALETHEVSKHKTEDKSTEVLTKWSKGMEEEEMEVSSVGIEKPIVTPEEVDENVKVEEGVDENTKPFSCHICGRKYNLKTTLQIHLIVHDAPELHFCEICNESFTTLNDLNTHVMKHETKKHITCSICFKEFTNQKLCNSHINQCHKPFESREDGKEEIKGIKEEIRFSSLKTRNKRKKNSHRRLKVGLPRKQDMKSANNSKVALKSPKSKPVMAPDFVCKVCNENCESKSGIQEHMKIHEDLICVICEKKCNNMEHLKSHVRHVHSKKKYVLCDFCGKSMLKSTYRTHLRIHMGDKPFQCVECGKSFTQKQHLLRHERCHTEDKFRCTMCRKGFYTEKELDHHIEMHKEEVSFEDECGHTVSQIRGEKTSYTCKVCKQTFFKWQTLIKHEKEAHPRLRFTCQICDEHYPNSSQLRAHYYSHTEEDLKELDENTRASIKKSRLLYNLCGECGKYVYKYHMETHMRIHTGEKPFECNICGKVFRLKLGLTVHQRIHTGEKPFQCEFCNKTFAQYAHLRNHTLLHSDEKPYLCQYCDKSFATPDYLYTHEKIHTRDKNAPPKRRYPCLYCGKRFRNTVNHMAHENNCEFKIDSSAEVFSDSDDDEPVEERCAEITVENSNPSIECVTEIHDSFEGPIVFKIEGNEYEYVPSNEKNTFNQPPNQQIYVYNRKAQ